MGGTWKQEDTTEKAKLKEKAIAMHAKVTMEKNESQKIRLILNVITPDNYEKKFKELRSFLFMDLKTKEECEDDDEKYDEDTALGDDNMRTDILETIV